MQYIATLRYIVRANYRTAIVADRCHNRGVRGWSRDRGYFAKRAARHGNGDRILCAVGHVYANGHDDPGDLLPAFGGPQASIKGNYRELLSATGATWLWGF